MPRLSPEKKAIIKQWLEEHPYDRVVKVSLYKTEPNNTAVIEITHADGYVRERFCSSPRDAARQLANITVD